MNTFEYAETILAINYLTGNTPQLLNEALQYNQIAKTSINARRAPKSRKY